MAENRKWITIGIALLLTLLMSSCAGLSGKPKLSPEEALRSRVAAYWDARVAGAPEKAYEILEPDARKTISLGSYCRKTGNSIILSYKIHDIKLDPQGSEAMVRVERSFRIRPGAIPINIDKTLEQTGNEPWVLVDGEWYMVYSPPGVNFMLPPQRQREDKGR